MQYIKVLCLISIFLVKFTSCLASELDFEILEPAPLFPEDYHAYEKWKPLIDRTQQPCRYGLEDWRLQLNLIDQKKKETQEVNDHTWSDLVITQKFALKHIQDILRLYPAYEELVDLALPYCGMHEVLSLAEICYTAENRARAYELWSHMTNNFFPEDIREISRVNVDLAHSLLELEREFVIFHNDAAGLKAARLMVTRGLYADACTVLIALLFLTNSRRDEYFDEDYENYGKELVELLPMVESQEKPHVFQGFWQLLGKNIPRHEDFTKNPRAYDLSTLLLTDLKIYQTVMEHSPLAVVCSVADRRLCKAFVGALLFLKTEEWLEPSDLYKCRELLSLLDYHHKLKTEQAPDKSISDEKGLFREIILALSEYFISRMQSEAQDTPVYLTTPIFRAFVLQTLFLPKTQWRKSFVNIFPDLGWPLSRGQVPYGPFIQLVDTLTSSEHQILIPAIKLLDWALETYDEPMKHPTKARLMLKKMGLALQMGDSKLLERTRKTLLHGPEKHHLTTAQLIDVTTAMIAPKPQYPK